MYYSELKVGQCFEWKEELYIKGKECAYRLNNVICDFPTASTVVQRKRVFDSFITFSTIPIGRYFEWRKKLYMRISDRNAINLESGLIMKFHWDEPVIFRNFVV